MSENCNHNCDGCSQSGSCSDEIVKSNLARGAKVKHVVGVVSGKGGVGKSFVTSYLATLLQREGYNVGILDADITGPSIPTAFGITQKAFGQDSLIYPVTTDTGIQVISSNMLLENDSDPIIWRGPMIAGLVEQFYSEVFWKDVDFLMVDMPPGTGDVPLTIFQKLPIEGIITVTTAQSLVSLIVEKAARMAEMMNVPILGLVTNMAYVTCPDCGKKIEIYGGPKTSEIARMHNIPVSAEIPLDPKISQYVDSGKIEDLIVDYLNPVRDALIELANTTKDED